MTTPITDDHPLLIAYPALLEAPPLALAFLLQEVIAMCRDSYEWSHANEPRNACPVSPFGIVPTYGEMAHASKALADALEGSEHGTFRDDAVTVRSPAE